MWRCLVLIIISEIDQLDHIHTEQENRESNYSSPVDKKKHYCPNLKNERN